METDSDGEREERELKKSRHTSALICLSQKKKRRKKPAKRQIKDWDDFFLAPGDHPMNDDEGSGLRTDRQKKNFCCGCELLVLWGRLHSGRFQTEKRGAFPRGSGKFVNN